jgi:hypothetical protein
MLIPAVKMSVRGSAILDKAPLRRCAEQTFPEYGASGIQQESSIDRYHCV